MNNETQHGYLVLADISGYTSYLAGTGLTHARDVLTEVLELIVRRYKPILNIVKLEDDAVFGYVSKTRIVRDEALLEMSEATGWKIYVLFTDAAITQLNVKDEFTVTSLVDPPAGRAHVQDVEGQ
jgi:hypothetical protein